MPDLTITKSHTGNFVQGSTNNTYTVRVSNSSLGSKGPGLLVSVTDTPPAGLTITGMSGSGWSCSILPTCIRTDLLSPFTSYPQITVTVAVAPNAISPRVNSVSVITTATESNANNNTATDSTVIAPPPTPTPSPVPAGIEGDVASRSTGDGLLLANDVVILRRFVVGDLSPDPTFNELQRADVSPFETKGDGLITSSDVVQVSRYVLGLDQAEAAAGPNESSLTAIIGGTFREVPLETPADRTLRVVSTKAFAGSEVQVSIELDSHGDEAGISFTLDYDLTKLADPRISLGKGVTSTILTTNTKELGRLMVLVDSGESILRSTRSSQLLTITFDVAENVVAGPTELTFGNNPTPASMSDIETRSLDAAYKNGVIDILNPVRSDKPFR